MRPEFTRPLRAPEAFLRLLRERLAAPHGAASEAGTASECRGQVRAGGALLRLCDAECRVWSPALHLDIEPAESTADGWRLRGTFSPSSPVWTAFLGIYIALATVGIGAACWGGAQLTMDEAPWAFLGVPITLALAGFTYGAAFIGQGLGAEDMYALRKFVEELAEHADAEGL
ncbi:MAG: hypothetical protein RL398_708 [Planctomycetota bacterium]|jgi:hypothetical protein